MKYIRFRWDCQTRYGEVVFCKNLHEIQSGWIYNEDWTYYQVRVPTLGTVKFYHYKITNPHKVKEITEKEYLTATIMNS